MGYYYVKNIQTIQIAQYISKIEIKLSYMKFISSSTSETETY